MAPEIQADTVVIGAGPAGLAVAGCLAQRGLKFELLEQEPNVGSAWRRHYDRLHLHTPRNHSGLPHLPMPKEYPTYPSRQQVVDYLESYAAKFTIQPRCGVTVSTVERDGDGWKVNSSAGVFRGRSVVMCTGYNRVPEQPTWPGMETFHGELVHSMRYKNGEAWRGKRVMVVGSGNSGAEIALDLLEHGATPLICIRGPVHVVSRDIGPIPAMNLAIATQGTPLWFRDGITRLGSKLRYGDLSPYGIHTPQEGPLTLIQTRGRIPLIDIGTISAIKKGQIKVVPGIERFIPSGVVTVDGQQHALDAIVLATGFRSGLERLLPGLEGRFTERGLPKSMPALAEVPRLYFIGYENVSTGLLRQIGIRALQVSEQLARELKN